MNGSQVVKKFVKSIVLNLRKRGILTEILNDSGITPTEWTFVKELFKPFEEDGAK